MLDHDARFEIETGRKTEILVRRAGKTINAAMLATAIGIDARFEPDIWTLIARDDRLGVVTKILRRAPRFFLLIRIGIDNIDIGKIDMQLFETIRRAPGSAAAVDGLATLRCFSDNRDDFPLRHR